MQETGEQIYLSDQDVLDCNDMSAVYGCGGGVPYFVYGYAYTAGVALQQKYPYEARQRECRQAERGGAYYYSPTPPLFLQPSYDEDFILSVFDAIGPLTISISVNANLMSYRGGIFDDASCEGQLSHGIVSLFLITEIC